MKVQHHTHAVFLAERQRGIQLAQLRFQPGVEFRVRRDLSRLAVADELPADQIRAPVLPQHAQTLGGDVRMNHRAAQSRLVVTRERRCRGRRGGSDALASQHGDLNVVELRAAMDRFQPEDQLRVRGIRGHGRFELDCLPIERARDLVLLEPLLPAWAAEMQHEFDAIVRLRRRSDVLRLDHGAAQQPRSAQRPDRQVQMDAHMARHGHRRGYRQRSRTLPARFQRDAGIARCQPGLENVCFLESSSEDDVAGLGLG